MHFNKNERTGEYGFKRGFRIGQGKFMELGDEKASKL
jgi:hypothetical protein